MTDKPMTMNPKVPVSFTQVALVTNCGMIANRVSSPLRAARKPARRWLSARWAIMTAMT